IQTIAVNGRRRARSVALVVAEPAAMSDLPHLLPGCGVVRHQVLGSAAGSEGVEAALCGRERRIAGACASRAPGHWWTTSRPVLQQSALSGDAISLLPAPLGPIVECTARSDGGQGQNGRSDD